MRDAKRHDLRLPRVATLRSRTLSAGYVNFFSAAGRSYRVIPQVDRQFRLTPEQLTQYHVRTESGVLIPLSTIVYLRDMVQPRQLTRFNQLNAATISGVPAPGVTLGTAFTLFVVPALYTVIAKEHHDRIPADTAAATSGLSR